MKAITEKDLKNALRAALGPVGEQLADQRAQTLDKFAELESMLKASGDSAARGRFEAHNPDGSPVFSMTAGETPAEAMARLQGSRSSVRYGWGPGRAAISGGDVRGLMAARAMRAFAVAQAENRSEDYAIEFANSEWQDPQLAGMLEETRDAKKNLRGSDSVKRREAVRILGSDEIGSGASAIAVEMAAEFLDFLHAQTVTDKLGAMRMPLRTGAMDQPFFNTAADVSHVGENTAKNESTPQDGNIRFDRKLVRGVAVYSNTWLRESSYAMDAVLRNHLATRAALVQDLGVLRGDGAEGAPLGISYYAGLAGNTRLRTQAGASSTLDEILDDLTFMFSAVEGGDVAMARMGWAAHPRTKWALYKQRDVGGGLLFGEEIRGGTLIGTPIETTTQIPTTLDATGDATDNETELVLADWASVAIAEGEGLETSSLDGAAYNDANGVVQSGFSRDQTAIRVTLGYDHAELYRGAEAYVLEGVDWAF